jgi:hypothetical protein
MALLAAEVRHIDLSGGIRGAEFENRARRHLGKRSPCLQNRQRTQKPARIHNSFIDHISLEPEQRR